MSDRRPTVTVGLPVYNGDNYLDGALQSLTNQDYGDFELIVSDNASTDGTRSILEEWIQREPRMSVYFNERNLGGAANFNRVLSLANGSYFRWASHDDLVEPSMLGRCVAELDTQGPSCVLVYPRTVVIDESGSELEVFDNRLDLRDSRPADRLRKFIANYERSNVIFGLMRSDAIKSVGGIPDYNPGDVVMIAGLALRGRFVEIPEPLFMRREHEQMSWKASKSPEGFARWFKPSRDLIIVFPTWRAWRELFFAVWKAPLRLSDKFACSSVVAIRWPVRHGMRLMRELVRIPRVLARRSLRRGQ